MMRGIVDLLCSMKRSVLACLLAAAAGLLSMGALGGLLYYAAYPVLGPLYGDIGEWHGDWVWPALILASMGWSPGFLVAGLVHRRLAMTGWGGVIARRMIYALILWMAAALIWMFVLSGSPGMG